MLMSAQRPKFCLIESIIVVIIMYDEYQKYKTRALPVHACDINFK